MADGCVDQRSLPRVKEACRDFAVLEDHSLAHSLQEQEIESHLASNVHRSRLVQQDIQVARQLQEEEDLAARARARQLHGKMERSDGEVAQEMQERLVHQAWLLRQQEEKDEAIARKLQEKEVKERRKKRSTKQVVTFEEPHYEDKGAFLFRREPRSSEALSPVWGSKPAPLEAGRSRLGFSRVGDEECIRSRDSSDSKRPAQKKEKPERPPPPRFGSDRELDEAGRDGSAEGEQEEDPLRDRMADGEPQKDESLEDVVPGGIRAQVAWASGSQGQGRPAGGQEDLQENKWPPRPARGPGWNTQAQYGIGDVTKSIAHLDMQDQEFKDLKVARRLQEEELKASQLDKRAAQVAKDEEIARLIMEEEKKNFMKSKNWDKRRPQGDFKQSGSEGVARPRSQEEGEINRTRSQKPVRPPPPSYKYENVESTYMPLKPSYSSQPSSRPEATHKGSFHRQ
ncbi:coiled-coil domain-containing protein 50-like isoform X1 [Scleropages formosus]|uniref:coiled-coil domain-containing protein 50-like isoform X1 n=1 Tax=Scleropages formosus TaxID=113540 RepID=UPI0010FAC5D0|nr:coiled-coil domain-containing protein 50-like isoform X1 [Scleropages formosus]